MKPLIIVPARGGSKRVPRKNIRPFCGSSLLEITTQAIFSCGIEATQVLSTDDEEIANEGQRLGLNVPFLRPKNISGDSATSVELVEHCLNWHRAEFLDDPGAFILLQPTSPFRSGDDIRLAWEILKTDPLLDGIVSVCATGLSFQHVYLENNDGHLLNPLPQGQPERNSVALIPNGSIYINRTLAFRKNQTFISDKTRPLVQSSLASIDIDTTEDWFMAETLYSSLKQD